MFIIFGLGNPGPQYHGTRHNAGFELVDLIADQANIDINKNKFKSMVGEGFFAGKKVVLIKPMTYMNLSGEAVVAALNFYKPAADEWMVVYDDMDLKPGAVRVREKGSSGGHNGMKSIIGLTGTDEFIRLRIGVGGARGNVISHVLGKFSREEEKPYTEGLLLAREAVKTIISGRVEDAMSQVNFSGKPPKKPRTPRREVPSQAADRKDPDLLKTDASEGAGPVAADQAADRTAPKDQAASPQVQAASLQEQAALLQEQAVSFQGQAASPKDQAMAGPGEGFQRTAEDRGEGSRTEDTGRLPADGPADREKGTDHEA